MAELSDEAKAFFQAAGRKGGLKGNHKLKGTGGDPVLREALREINRTRRTVSYHDDGCWCDDCRRYFMAKQKLASRKEKQS